MFWPWHIIWYGHVWTVDATWASICHSNPSSIQGGSIGSIHIYPTISLSHYIANHPVPSFWAHDAMVSHSRLVTCDDRRHEWSAVQSFASRVGTWCFLGRPRWTPMNCRAIGILICRAMNCRGFPWLIMVNNGCYHNYLLGGLNPSPLKNDGVTVNGKDDIHIFILWKIKAMFQTTNPWWIQGFLIFT